MTIDELLKILDEGGLEPATYSEAARVIRQLQAERNAAEARGWDMAGFASAFVLMWMIGRMLTYASHKLFPKKSLNNRSKV